MIITVAFVAWEKSSRVPSIEAPSATASSARRIEAQRRAMSGRLPFAHFDSSMPYDATVSNVNAKAIDTALVKIRTHVEDYRLQHGHYPYMFEYDRLIAPDVVREYSPVRFTYSGNGELYTLCAKYREFDRCVSHDSIVAPRK